MKKILLLLAVAAVVVVFLNRERLYLRDPIAIVTRDGAKEAGVQVFINYSNDVLLEKDRAPMSLTLVQHGQRVGTPVGLKCLHYLVCRTDAAVSTMILERTSTVESMSSKYLRFRGEGRETVVQLY